MSNPRYDDDDICYSPVYPRKPAAIEIILYFDDGPMVSEIFHLKKETNMDAKIKKIQKKTKSLQKDEAALLKMDKKHDKIIKKAKKKAKK